MILLITELFCAHGTLSYTAARTGHHRISNLVFGNKCSCKNSVAVGSIILHLAALTINAGSAQSGYQQSH